MTMATDIGAETILAARGLDLRYGRVQILFDVSIDVRRGEFVALLGTNGAGKSTFLKAVSNLSPISSGRVHFEGDDITLLPPDVIAARGLAHVPGGRGSLPDLTVEENLRLGGHLLRSQKGRLAEGMARAFDLFPWMVTRRRQLAGTLSGGEQQMLAIARALVTEPSMLMVDELSLGLAPIIVEELMGVLKTLNGQGITVLVVEQHATLAMEVAERVLFMEKGQVRFSGDGRDLLGREDLLRSVFLGAGH
ncbi:MAG: branched-chain amino acid transport system ATP-binding protein livF [Actinomycetota bacterium]|jgi:ABC-type branched-subunit amino acid transport system ATPase component|nr:branched-chain amino acid transport system ATP-binding protein livF [Actinomycetota bacterium]